MKLTVEMVPKTSWKSNLRSILTKKQWDVIRKNSYEKANNVCEICGRDGMLHCHEQWEYDDDKHLQKLTGLVSLCRSCHMCKHFGFALTMHHKGIISIDRIKNHFMDINGVAEDEFRKIVKDEIARWVERSQEEWSLDISYLGKYIEENNLEIGDINFNLEKND